MQERWNDFIQTPNTLKLDSKKYPWEWGHNFLSGCNICKQTAS